MIIITGDSWGIGEWGLDDTGSGVAITGPGVAQLISLHNKSGSVNLSQGGGSNTIAIKKLAKFLLKFTPDENDIFYWIVSDPTRCVTPSEFLNNCSSLETKALAILDNTLKVANAIGKKYNIKINLIGGLCDLDQKIVKKYDNLILTAPSWLSLINENYTPCIFSNSGQWMDIAEIIPSNRYDLKEEFISIANLLSLKAQFVVNNPKYFNGTDDHPNRYGHRVLKDYLYPEYSHIY